VRTRTILVAQEKEPGTEAKVASPFTPGQLAERSLHRRAVESAIWGMPLRLEARLALSDATRVAGDPPGRESLASLARRNSEGVRANRDEGGLAREKPAAQGAPCQDKRGTRGKSESRHR
jgi:hypothetical protein